MNRNYILFLIGFLLASSCVGTKPSVKTDYSILSMEELTRKKENLTLAVNHQISMKYIEYLKTNQKTPAIGKFGFKEIRNYWKTVPELNKYRNDFEIADEKLRGFIISRDYRYKIAIERLKQKEISTNEYNSIKYEVFRELEQNCPDEYLPVREDRETKLYKCNVKTLEYIINDYHGKSKLFPIDWIDSDELNWLKNSRFVKKIYIELSAVEKEIIDRI